MNELEKLKGLLDIFHIKYRLAEKNYIVLHYGVKPILVKLEKNKLLGMRSFPLHVISLSAGECMKCILTHDVKHAESEKYVLLEYCKLLQEEQQELMGEIPECFYLRIFVFGDYGFEVAAKFYLMPEQAKEFYRNIVDKITKCIGFMCCNCEVSYKFSTFQQYENYLRKMTADFLSKFDTHKPKGETNE